MTGESSHDSDYYDEAPIWTSTPCAVAATGAPGRLAHAGARRWRTSTPTECLPPDGRAYVKCCADSAEVMPVTGADCPKATHIPRSTPARRHRPTLDPRVDPRAAPQIGPESTLRSDQPSTPGRPPMDPLGIDPGSTAEDPPPHSPDRPQGDSRSTPDRAKGSARGVHGMYGPIRWPPIDMG